ncbi:26S proteasome non-ATPase regulatory subunit 10-like isoform X2 [Littorina saxatilis]|uniref:26S proteasome non-ATPase regulatory subunit 10-like isoform X2 n=1 Tax=Littorina saxatilis TaxID=31220 RepID=UPI0038B5F92C
MASLRELQQEIKEGLQEMKIKSRGLNSKQQALMTAIGKHEVEKVDHLLNQGVDPNFRAASGDRPIHMACSATVDDRLNAEQIVEMLVYMGADQEVHDRFGRLPLHVAAANSHRMVRVLLDKGCSINAQDNAGCTALMEACSHNKNDPLDTVTLLLQHDANVHLKDEQGSTGLHCICRTVNLDTELRNQIALLLLHAGLSATVFDYEGRMALCYELDKVLSISYRLFPQVSLQLIETLVCAGSNLFHNCKDHQYWVRYVANTSSSKTLSALLQILSPVLTRPCLHMIHKIVMDLHPEDDDDGKDDDGTACLQVQVHEMSCTVDSLQLVCRRIIRAKLKGKLLITVPELPLPNRLKRFLTSLDRKPTV